MKKKQEKVIDGIVMIANYRWHYLMGVYYIYASDLFIRAPK